jgi:hypothetical protein
MSNSAHAKRSRRPESTLVRQRRSASHRCGAEQFGFWLVVKEDPFRETRETLESAIPLYGVKIGITKPKAKADQNQNEQNKTYRRNFL